MRRCRAAINSTLGSRVRLKKIFFSFLFFFHFCHLHLCGPGSRGWETKAAKKKNKKNRQNKLRDQAVFFGGLGELSSVTNAGKDVVSFWPSGADFRAELHPRPRRAVHPNSVAESPTERAFGASSPHGPTPTIERESRLPCIPRPAAVEIA
jgi:hypothetical protein